MTLASKKLHLKVTRRRESYAEKISTRIWQEQPSAANPYIVEASRCHGYDLMELAQGRSYIEMLYLLFRGELPTRAEAQLLEQLMILLINPGPRHPAARAAMQAGVGKTDAEQVLPISLAILSGSHLGAAEIEPAMRFLRKQRRADPQQVVETLFAESTPPEEGDWHIVPGFGSRFGGIDIQQNTNASHLTSLEGSGVLLQWGYAFASALEPHQMGWLATGLAAATFADLGFQPRYGAGLFQLISAPGLLAHGM